MSVKTRWYKNRSHYGTYEEFQAWIQEVDEEITLEQQRNRNEREAEESTGVRVGQARNGQMNRYRPDEDDKSKHDHDWYDPKTHESGSKGAYYDSGGTSYLQRHSKIRKKKGH